MNNLNNQQLVLLAILVSFVTSIATGIFTVTLLEQAPPAVTQTINRVVERTVETVIPTTEKETIVRERVIVDKGGDIIVAAIKKASPSVISIGTFVTIPAKDENSKPKEEFRKTATGFFVESDGLIVAMNSELKIGGNYFIRLPVQDATKVFKLKVDGIDEKTGLALLRVAKEEDEKEFSFPALMLARSDISVGQTAVVLNTGIVAVSFVSGLVRETVDDHFYRLYLEGNEALSGGPVINVQEEVIGILTGDNKLVTAEKISIFMAEVSKQGSVEEIKDKIDETP